MPGNPPVLPNPYVLEEKLWDLAAKVADYTLPGGSRALDRQVACSLGLYGYNPQQNGRVNRLQSRTAAGVFMDPSPSVPRYTHSFDAVLPLAQSLQPLRLVLEPGKYRPHDCTLILHSLTIEGSGVNHACALLCAVLRAVALKVKNESSA